MNLNLIGRCILLSVVLSGLASAQPKPGTFQFVATLAGHTSSVDNGGTVTFFSHIGQAQTAHVVATYSGTGTVTISAQPTLVGSLAFTGTVNGTLPITVGPAENFSFDVRFLPTTSAQVAGQLNLAYSELIPPESIVNPPVTVQGTMRLGLAGSAPSFVLSYALQSDPNVVPLQNGDTITFAPTVVGSTAQAAFTLTNTGSGLGTIANIAITGAAFRLTGLPLFPSSVNPGGSLAVIIQYRPTGLATDTGQINVTFEGDAPVTIKLQGSGSSASLVYQILTDPPTPVGPGDTVTLPKTNLGQTSNIVIRVSNNGNASGTVNSINVIGTGFQLGPGTTLPQTLAPSAGLTFSVIFTPAQPGTASGTLFINSDALKLSGVGLGPLLSYSYSTAGISVTIASGGSVVFSPVMITQSSQVTFTIKNTGTLAATLSNIGIGQVNSPFSLTGLPALPLSIAPDADLTFPISFAPIALGFSNGTLQLDASSVPLIGSGTQPPPLPSYTFSGASGATAPGSQPSIRMTLANPYPVAISGTLTLSVGGNLPADPAVQFSTGGRTVAFVIPANATNAVFANQGTQIGLQTGTVAGTLTLTPSFATQAGNVNLTPDTPSTLQLTVAPAAPSLIAIQLTNRSATGFTVAVTGFTTTRTLTVENIQLTPAAGFQMPASQFTIDLQQVATAWFRGTASQAFGGQYTLSIPFTFAGDVPAGQTAVNGIASVVVTMSNEQGSSNSLTAKLP